MNSVRFLTLFTSVFFLLGNAVAQMTTIPEKATVTKISDGLHLIMGMGGNILVSSGEDGVLMVDDDMPPLAKKIEAAVAEITDQPVKYLINTHWHFDHTGGNKYFGEQGAIIVAQDNVRMRMSTEQFSKFTNSKVPPSAKVALQTITYDDHMTFHINGETIRLMHVKKPAHTDGDTILFFENADLVHMGDNFFNGLYPVIDISAGGTAQGMIDSMDKIAGMVTSETILVPGHGPVSNLEGMMRFRNLLHTVNGRILEALDAGKTEDEVVAMKPSADFDDEWAWPFMPPERWTRIMYQSAVLQRANESAP